MIVINGVELNFNIFNATHVERWEKGREKVAEQQATIEQFDMDKGLPEYIKLLRAACNAIFDMFDSIFGDGTSNKIFGDECDFSACLDAMEKFENDIEDQAIKTKARVSRYAPIGKNK